MKYIIKKLIKWYGKTEKGANALITLAVKDAFTTISSDDILKMRVDGSMSYHDKILSPQQVEQIKQEAKFLMSSLLWKVLKTDIRYKVSKEIFDKADNPMGMLAGKAVLWLEKTENDRLEELTR